MSEFGTCPNCYTLQRLDSVERLVNHTREINLGDQVARFTCMGSGRRHRDSFYVKPVTPLGGAAWTA